MRFGAALAALGVLVTTIFAMPARDAPAFNLGVHEFITAVGLGPPVGRTLSFLRPAMVDDIADEHARMDAGFPSNNIAEDQRHFDDCEFDGAAEFIGARYRAAGRTLRGHEPFDATDMFGEALHPAQDLYAHANWVEMGFPLADNPATDEVEVTQRDLLDLSGAQSSLARPWGAPAGGGVVRNGILLGADDWNIPAGWSIDADGGGRHIPTLIDPQGETRGRLLVTGEGTADDECDVFISGPPGRRAYNGLEHGVLNKDGPNGPKGARAHRKAMALATLQTGYEWCRLVRQAALQNRDGLLLTTWVRGGGNPHPANTPCAAGRAGPTSIVVTVQSVRVLDSGDDNDNDPGEIQVAVALYDDPLNFRRSVHTENRQGRVALDDGESMPADRLPAPVSLCVPSGRGATFALHGWDNDDGSGDLLANDFDDKGDDDELLVGFQRRFRAGLPTGVQVARSDDLEVRYRVGRRRPPALPCPPEVLPPIPAATASGPAQIRGGLADIGRSWRASRDR